MPELPEVETVCRGLAKVLSGKSIKAVRKNRADMRIPFPKGLEKVAGQKVLSIARRAKYILIHLSGGQTMLVHLGMSGRMVIAPEKEDKHDHMVVTMQDGVKVVLNDPRRFGLVDLVATEKLDAHRFFAHLGPEPLDAEFTPAYLAAALAGKKPAIKVAIMDQRIVVGVGNIYAAEALYMSGIDPTRAAGSLNAAEIKKLVTAIRKVLEAAIKSGGSSLRDYVQADGELGYFQHHFAVYDREGEKCKGCTCKAGIKRITQAGRSTFYCAEKQL